MADKNNTKKMKCQLETREGSPLKFNTPAVVKHECEYLCGEEDCLYSGFCDFQEVDEGGDNEEDDPS